MQEARKIFGDPQLRVSATCVRVPVLRAHCVAVTLECRDPITPERVRELLSDAPGVRIVDDVANNYFPMPKDASGQDDVLVGRIRRDLSDPSGRSISLFCAGDQLLKGAALNAVQIAEQWLERGRASAKLSPSAASRVLGNDQPPRAREVDRVGNAAGSPRPVSP